MAIAPGQTRKREVRNPWTLYVGMGLISALIPVHVQTVPATAVAASPVMFG